MANIHEIAKKAGVSASTVSRAINNTGYVSPETKKKIMEIVEALDYIPNQNAVSLKKGETLVLAVITSYFSDTFSAFLRAFTIASQKKGYGIHLIYTNYQADLELNALELLRKKQIDGICLFSRSNEWPVIEKYRKYGPIVTAQRYDSQKIPSVYLDHYVGYSLSLEHLYTQGARKIAHAFASERNLNTKMRIQAAHDFSQRHQLPCPDAYFFFDQTSREDGENLTKWWLEMPAERPDAFATASDLVAGGIVTELRRQKIHLPTDMKVMGFDNIELSAYLDLSTVEYPIEKQAENAFRMLYNTLHHKNLAVEMLDFKVIQRKTT